MPIQLKNILVPTDFSDCANAAATVGIQLAKQCGAKLHFLHLTVDQIGPRHVPGNVLEMETKKVRLARAKLFQLVRKAEAERVEARPELVIGTGAEHIEDYLIPFGIDLLVMGSHGATGIREAIIGSQTQHVIRNCKIPSLVVKKLPTRPLPKNIVFASTFRRDSSHALRQIFRFVKHWDASLHLLFINWIYHLIDERIAHEMMEKEMEVFTDIRFTQNIAETNNKEFGIAQFANKIDADMIAVAQEQQGMFDRMIHPSLAEKLINHSPLPILVANAELF